MPFIQRRERESSARRRVSVALRRWVISGAARDTFAGCAHGGGALHDKKASSALWSFLVYVQSWGHFADVGCVGVARGRMGVPKRFRRKVMFVEDNSGRFTSGTTWDDLGAGMSQVRSSWPQYKWKQSAWGSRRGGE